VTAGKEPHVAICELPDREPNLRLADQREHDVTDQDIWLKVLPARQVHHSGKTDILF